MNNLKNHKDLLIRMHCGVKLALAFLMLLAFAFSCTSYPAAKSLDVVVNKVIPTSGLDFWLLLRNGKGQSIKANGVVRATLWYQQPADSQGVVSREAIMQEWANIEISIADFAPYLGANVFLEYNDDNKDLNLQLVWGILDVAFKLEDGTVISAEETFVKIASDYGC